MWTGLQWPWAWRQRGSAWGAVLDEQAMVLAALSRQKVGGVRVVMFDHVQAPDGLVQPSQRDAWLVESLRGAGEQLPRRHRTMALALHESRCRQGELQTAARTLREQSAQVRHAAANAFGVDVSAVGYDFEREQSCDHEQGSQLRWAACLREELHQWQAHARHAGWRLPLVEPADQSVARAASHWRGDRLHHWTTSPQDWQFDAAPQRQLLTEDWVQLRASPMWAALACCGAALGAMV
jgi:Tfp pilus assembly PilM family ATPase